MDGEVSEGVRVRGDGRGGDWGGVLRAIVLLVISPPAPPAMGGDVQDDDVIGAGEGSVDVAGVPTTEAAAEP